MEPSLWKEVWVRYSLIQHSVLLEGFSWYTTSRQEKGWKHRIQPLEVHIPHLRVRFEIPMQESPPHVFFYTWWFWITWDEGEGYCTVLYYSHLLSLSLSTYYVNHVYIYILYIVYDYILFKFMQCLSNLYVPLVFVVDCKDEVNWSCFLGDKFLVSLFDHQDPALHEELMMLPFNSSMILLCKTHQQKLATTWISTTAQEEHQQHGRGC